MEDPDLDPGQVILISGHAEEDVADLVAASPSLGFVNKSELSAAVIQQLLNGSGGTASGYKDFDVIAEITGQPTEKLSVAP